MDETRKAPLAPGNRVVEVLKTSLYLGVSAFGGPVAHLGYFERTYVRQKRWLSEAEFSQMVALCQILPGPASSQVNFLIGLQRAGWWGALLSWVGFTLPSALIMFAFALLLPLLQGDVSQAAIHGMKLAAVAVVGQAVRNMALSLCPDLRRRVMALLCMAVCLLAGGAWAQMGVIVLGGTAGWLWISPAHGVHESAFKISTSRAAWIACALFVGLLAGMPLLQSFFPSALAHMADACYRAGALVFGGGHVVLPLLHGAMVPAWMSDDAFLAGYGAAQALPGPLFAFSAYLGAVAAPTGDGGLWACVALCFVFLPGLLAAVAGAYFWGRLQAVPGALGALAGINAAVVGILAAALYNPVWTSAVRDFGDAGVALLGYWLLTRWKIPPLWVVLGCVAVSVGVRWTS